MMNEWLIQKTGAAAHLVVVAALGAGLCACGADSATDGAPSFGSKFDGASLPSDDAGEDPWGATDGFGEKPGPDAGEDDPPISTTEWIEFVDVIGDDGAACKGEPICFIKMFFNGTRKLSVRYVRDGMPASLELLAFDVVGAGAAETLSAQPNSVYTSDDGVGATTLDVVLNQPGTYEVKVSAPARPQVAPIRFHISLESKLGPPLIIKFSPAYDKTQVKFQKIETTLWKQVPGKPFACSSMDLLSGFPPGGIGLPKVAKVEDIIEVPQLLGLAEELEQFYTVASLGTTASGGIKVLGCNDTDAHAVAGKSTTVVVTLFEAPPDYTGRYDVVTYLDLTSALPKSVKQILDIVFGFFESPVGGLALIACALDDIDALESLCGYVFANPKDPKIGEWAGGFAGIIIDVVDQILIGLIESSALGKAIFYTGKDVAQLLTKLELHSEMELVAKPGGPSKKAIPDKSGFFSTEQCFHTWESIHLKWTLGAGCDAADPSCGAYEFSFSEFSSTPDVVSSKFGAQVSPTFYDMNIMPHSVNFKYGALLNAVIKKQLLPAIFGDGSDGYAKVDTYEEVLMSFMCGKEGLLPGADCCQMFADDIAGNGGGLISGTIKVACTLLIDVGVDFLESQLTGLDTNLDNLTLETASPCKLYDVDDDGRIDSWGKATEPCMWSIELDLFGLEAKFDADFYAIRKK